LATVHNRIIAASVPHTSGHRYNGSRSLELNIEISGLPSAIGFSGGHGTIVIGVDISGSIGLQAGSDVAPIGWRPAVVR
jgi:hypothetical protein